VQVGLEEPRDACDQCHLGASSLVAL